MNPEDIARMITEDADWQDAQDIAIQALVEYIIQMPDLPEFEFDMDGHALLIVPLVGTRVGAYVREPLDTKVPTLRVYNCDIDRHIDVNLYDPEAIPKAARWLAKEMRS